MGLYLTSCSGIYNYPTNHSPEGRKCAEQSSLVSTTLAAVDYHGRRLTNAHRCSGAKSTHGVHAAHDFHTGALGFEKSE